MVAQATPPSVSTCSFSDLSDRSTMEGGAWHTPGIAAEGSAPGLAVEDGASAVRPPGYPVRWESDVVLSDGGVVHVRPIRPDDEERIVAFHGRQSAESIYFRYFSSHPRLSDREVE